jgi:hypothetical protein
MSAFLSNRDPRRIEVDLPEGMSEPTLFPGLGAASLEVVVIQASSRPSATALKEIHQKRVGRRPAPVLLVALWGGDRAAICGDLASETETFTDESRDRVERLCDAALQAPDRHSASRFIWRALAQLGAPLPGIRNEGLFATHQLQHGVPQRSDWRAASNRASSAVTKRGRDLIEALDFTIEQTPKPVSLLLAKGTKVAVAVFLQRPDEIEPSSPNFDGTSPVSFALAQADRENLDYVVIAAGSSLRIYPVKPGLGIGRRGRTETYIELDLDLLGGDHTAYLWLLASADALCRNGTFTKILEQSAEFAAELGARLRERVYDEVVPPLAVALVKARNLRNPTAEQLAETYEMSLLVLFRLLFVAYAEDKELLPLHTNVRYREHSLKTIARRLADAERNKVEFGNQDFYWREVLQTWKAVDKGNPEWGVPAYNGGLFSTAKEESVAGYNLSRVSLSDADFAPALAALLVDDAGDDVPGPIDFRSLGVREFGTIYEGLLESELSVAESNLKVDPKTNAYLPAKARDDVVVQEGQVYLHNASGARKSSGAYYTKPFAVEHLLDHALEPALIDHLTRVNGARSTREKAERFFDFRVADIAMGSGHFLVAAIDRIERALSGYLTTTPLPDVTNELERLRREARNALGDNWAGDPIEDTQLLRRQIARRCIFGVDVNPLSVELARLSIWIHTFVPGLPLSLLDRNLAVGNSLVGIATFEEAAELIPTQGDLFAFVGTERLKAAREPLIRYGRLADANAAEIKEAKELYASAHRSIAGEEDLLTVLTASRIDGEIAAEIERGDIAGKLDRQGDVFTDRIVRKAEQVLQGLRPFHFPTAFPQVFLGNRAGFDVIIGNPPWEEPKFEDRSFWLRHFPGMRSQPQGVQDALMKRYRRERPDLVSLLEKELATTDALRAMLGSSAYPGMGTGDPDLYKAFCWRFLRLTASEGGRIGVVLPRSALSAKGSTEFRNQLFDASSAVDVTMLMNNRQWLFEGVDPRYTIALLAVDRSKARERELSLRGPYSSLEGYRLGVVREPARFSVEEVKSWTDTSSLPLLPSDESVDAFTQLRRSPRLDIDVINSWKTRPQAELHATNDKRVIDLESEKRPTGFWPVFKGESFDLWEPDRGSDTYYGWADPAEVIPILQDKRANSARSYSSPFAGFPTQWIGDDRTLPCHFPRIAFRNITNRTNKRTFVVALVPGNIFLTNAAPYFLFPRGTERDMAFLLGVLSSLSLDWYARRFVELNMNFYLVNPFPIPRSPDDDPLRVRSIELSGRLASTDKRYSRWAKAVGVDHGPLAADEKEDMIYELDAVVAQLYGLSEPQLVHIFETFHEGWDYQDRLDATLIHFRSHKKRA